MSQLNLHEIRLFLSIKKAVWDIFYPKKTD